MRLIFLGTSAGAPTRTRNVTSLVLQWVQSGKIWLFDCGEGTQHQFHKAPVSLSRLDQIFVTHMHGDHVFGLPGLVASRSSSLNAQSQLNIFGPDPLNEFLSNALTLSHTRIKYPWTFQSLQQGVVFEDDSVVVECRLLNHGIPSYGFAIREKDQPGEFKPDEAKKQGVPAGPEYGILKNGGSITLTNGRIVNGADLVGTPRAGRKVVICGDTAVSKATVELAAGADILVHEATYMCDKADRAAEIGHSTSVQAAQAALEAGVGQLILTHFSPRYEQENSDLMADLLNEAQAIFPNTLLAHDFLSVEVSPKSV